MSKEMPSVADILRQGAATFEERGKIYGDNWRRVGAVMEAMFPEGLPRMETNADFLKLQFFMMIAVKMTRLAVANMAHQDSVHDIMVYAAMWERHLLESPSSKPEFCNGNWPQPLVEE